MRTALIPASVAAVLSLMSAATAQTQDQPQSPAPGDPAGMPAGTRQAAPGKPAAHQPNQADRTFLHAAMLGGAAEVAFAQLAGKKSGNAKVKEFAQRMAHDHGEANKRLATLNRNDALPAVQGLDPDHKAMHDRLARLDGPAFDRAYLDSQIADHQVMAQLLEYEIGSGQDPQVKAAASQLLPTILAHLEMADALAATLAAQSTASTSPR